MLAPGIFSISPVAKTRADEPTSAPLGRTHGSAGKPRHQRTTTALSVYRSTDLCTKAPLGDGKAPIEHFASAYHWHEYVRWLLAATLVVELTLQSSLVKVASRRLGRDRPPRRRPNSAKPWAKGRQAG